MRSQLEETLHETDMRVAETSRLIIETDQLIERLRQNGMATPEVVSLSEHR